MVVPELSATTNFTFLTGASHPEEMVERAAELGLSAIAITDRNSLAGVVRAHVRLREIRKEAKGIKPRNITGADVREHAARIRSQVRVDPSSRLSEAKVQERFSQKITPPPAAPDTYASLPDLIIGARLVLQDTAIEFSALCPDRPAYARLCRLLTNGKRRADKGDCRLTLDDLANGTDGLILIAHLPDPLAAVTQAQPSQPGGRADLATLAEVTRRLDSLAGLALAPVYDGRDAERFTQLSGTAKELSLALVAVANPVLHRGNRRQLADILPASVKAARSTVWAIGRCRTPNVVCAALVRWRRSFPPTHKPLSMRKKSRRAVPSRWTNCAMSIPMKARARRRRIV